MAGVQYDETTGEINWLQYTSASNGNEHFFTQKSYEQYSIDRSFAENLDWKIAELAQYNASKGKQKGPPETSNVQTPQSQIKTDYAKPGNLEKPAERRGGDTKYAAVAPPEHIGYQGPGTHEKPVKKRGGEAKYAAVAPPEQRGYQGPGTHEKRPAVAPPEQRGYLGQRQERQHKLTYIAPLRTRVPYPRDSSLNVDEQKRYLDLFQKFMSYVPTKPTQTEIVEIQQFKDLQLRVGPEQQEFMKYLEHAAGKCVEDYVQINPDARQFTEEFLQSRSKRAEKYPRHYMPLDQVSLDLKKPFVKSEAPVLSCLATLLDLGPPPKVILPSMTGPTKPRAFLDYGKVSKRYPPGMSHDRTQNWSKEVCSHDVNCEKFAIQYDANVVLSPGVVTCLMNNHGPAYERPWEMPIVVKEYTVDEKGKKVPRKVVFLDKPFIPLTVNPRYKNMLYHKYTLKAMLSHPQHKTASKFRTKGKDAEKGDVEKPKEETSGELVQEKEESSELWPTSYSIDDLETFGTERSVGAGKKRSHINVEQVLLEAKSLKKKIFGSESESGSELDLGAKGLGLRKSVEGSMEIGKGTKLPDLGSFDSPQSPELPVLVEKPKQTIELESPESPTGLVIADLDKHAESGMDLKTLDYTSAKSSTHTKSDRDSPLSPCVERSDRDSPLSPLAGGGDTPQSPVATPCSPEATPQSPEATPCSPKATPQSPEATPQSPEATPQSPEATPQSPEATPHSPEATPQSPEATGRNSPQSPITEPKERLFLAGPKIIPMERIDDPENDNFEEAQGKSVSKPAAEIRGKMAESSVPDVEQMDIDTSAPDHGVDTSAPDHGVVLEKSSKGKRGRAPVRRSLRGQGKPSEVDSVGSESRETGRRKSGRLNKPAERAVESMECEAKTVDSSEDEFSLVIDVASEVMTPPKRLTRQRSRQGIVQDSKEKEEKSASRSRSRDPSADTSPAPRLTRAAARSRRTPTPSGEPSKEMERSRSPMQTDEPVAMEIESPSTDVVDTPRGRTLRSRKRTSEPPDTRVTRQSDHSSVPTPETPEVNLGRRKRGRARKSSVGTPEVLDTATIVDNQSDAKSRHVEETVLEQKALDSELKEVTSKDEGTVKDQVEIEQTAQTAGVEQQTLIDTEMKKDPSTCSPEVDEVTEMKEHHSPEVVPTSSDATTAKVAEDKLDMKPEKQKSGMTLDAILNLQQQMLRPGEKMKEDAAQEMPSDANQYRPCSTDNNAVYSLWTLGHMKLIIRTSHHGFIRDAVTQKMKPVYIFPKLEYQPMFGVEQVTVSEVTKMWTSAFLRLNCNVVRARIDAFTSEIMTLEDLDPSKVLPPRGMFDPGVAMQKLHDILEKVSTLPPGVHLLKHTPGEARCQILQNIKAKKRGSYDLHQTYMCRSLQEEAVVDWVPLDPNVILPFHRRMNRVPAAFNPKGPFLSKKKKKKKSKSKK